MDTIYIFKRQVIKRSNDHKAAMHALLIANVPSQMASVLRQELDSMVRVIFLLGNPEKDFLIWQNPRTPIAELFDDETNDLRRCRVRR